MSKQKKKNYVKKQTKNTINIFFNVVNILFWPIVLLYENKKTLDN